MLQSTKLFDHLDALFVKGFLAYYLTFFKMDASRKKTYTGELRTCRNYLRIDYFATGCPSQSRCRDPKSQAQHRTLLHDCYREEMSTANTTQSRRTLSTYMLPVSTRKRG